ncbi:unnamed protein product, partial [Tetraodon nigroviridis]
KRERKPQRPGKYVCTYCSRACAKPSVLQKHIRSHTGERPYPCGPCGFSFKTKSNLYKHRKSHTHRVKAGLVAGGPRSAEDQPSESEDDTRLSHAERQCAAALRSREMERSQDWAGGGHDSYAVKKRLALRLSRARHGPQDPPGPGASAPTFGSKGSTESGYFSRSESTDGPPEASTDSYADLVLGKYGRPGHPQRAPRQQSQQPPGGEEPGAAIRYHKDQVIDHITKLISINEALVDTSTIDRVKPRRFSLSGKTGAPPLRRPSTKGTLVPAPLVVQPGVRAGGSITMGVPCGKFHQASPSVDTPADRAPSPLVRSRSTPSTQASPDPPGCGSAHFRSAQSLDERQPAARPASRRFGTLRRQPAIELPLGAEPDGGGEGPDACSRWEGLQGPGPHPQPPNQVVTGLNKDPVRTGPSAVRKRRKEESFESDDPPSSGGVLGGPGGPAPHACSVIQHTSSFENQESPSSQTPAAGAGGGSPPAEELPPHPQGPPQPESPRPGRGLVRQNSVQLPEILVTEDSGPSAAPSAEAGPPEKADDFQWPRRSPSLSQLPIEKLPPKKKRLRLAEAAQSSGESSFDSGSLSRSPSRDSGASSRSASLDEPSRADAEVPAPPSLRRSRVASALAVPGAHQPKEMRRSASEQAPHQPTSGAVLAESRSRSLDYGCLSPERTALEIPPPPEGDGGAPQTAPLIACSRELLRPPASPAVAVRLQADTLTLAGAIYTALSQAAGPQEKAAPPGLDPDLQRAPGAGANKRLLSPASSLEAPPEAQQKRVREEEGEQEPGPLDEVPLEAGEEPRAPATGAAPSFPSLLPRTCNSWCYLKYTKPNPWALDPRGPSVYSSWSTAGYDPNPPGLSSKAALALLSCRQRRSPSIYTTSPMDGGRPPQEVHTSRSHGGDQDATAEGRGGEGEQGGAKQQEEEMERRQGPWIQADLYTPVPDASERSPEDGEHTSTQLAGPEPDRCAGGVAPRRAPLARRGPDASSQGGARSHGDGVAAGADEVGPAHTGPQRTRGPDNLLRHLPLHSQHPGGAPSLLVPIGGIYMIQPRSLLPLYTLDSSPSLSPPWRLGHTPKRTSPPRRRGSRASSPEQEDSGPGE